MNFFLKGFRAIIPIAAGVVPFGAVMGTVAADAKVSFFQSSVMNLIVFAGASQLAAIDLMTKHTASVIVIVTGLIINLRFLLYSAALVPVVQKSSFFVKLLSAYNITDQNYAVMVAHQKILHNKREAVQFYLGASLCMFLTWQSSVIGGYIFGNFAPQAWALEFAVPLSFMVLLIPTLKNSKYVIVALFSATFSLLLSSLPMRVGLIITALLGVLLGGFLSRKKTT